MLTTGKNLLNIMREFGFGISGERIDAADGFVRASGIVPLTRSFCRAIERAGIPGRACSRFADLLVKAAAGEMIRLARARRLPETARLLSELFNEPGILPEGIEASIPCFDQAELEILKCNIKAASLKFASEVGVEYSADNGGGAWIRLFGESGEMAFAAFRAGDDAAGLFRKALPFHRQLPEIRAGRFGFLSVLSS